MTAPTKASKAPKTHKAPKAPNADDARQRLQQAALRLFAQQGFSKTSTRELAEAAQVNVAAISYYFGDKAGLYRAVFFAPDGQAGLASLAFAEPRWTLPQALRHFYADFIKPLAQGEAMRLCMKLHFREMIEPTGLWQEEITHGIAPMHAALVALLAQHLAVPVDADLQRLTVCLTGIAVHLHVGRDVIDIVAPGLTQNETQLQHWVECLTRCALAMIEAEATRRAALVGRTRKPTQTARAVR